MQAWSYWVPSQSERLPVIRCILHLFRTLFMASNTFCWALHSGYNAPVRNATRHCKVMLILTHIIGKSCSVSWENRWKRCTKLSWARKRCNICNKPNMPTPRKSVFGSFPWNPISSQCGPVRGQFIDVPVILRYTDCNMRIWTGLESSNSHFAMQKAFHTVI